MADVLLEMADGIALVTLDDPGRRNAVGLELADRLVAAIETVTADPTSKAVIITGAGAAFCAGADRGLLARADESSLRRVYQSFLSVRSCPLPTLAAVNGPAVGAGFNLALACDVRIAAESASFDARFLQLPIHPGGGHLWMLERLVGPQAAAAITVFGQAVPGRRAAELGLAWSCVPDPDLLAAARACCTHLSAAPAVLGPQIKRTLRRVSDIAFDAAVELELGEQLSSTRAPEFVARMAQFR